MEYKEKRHKVEEREEFTDSQKSAIAEKSSDRCAWCGKKVYFGYGATVDHFIPIKKGGTNDPENLVMMCYECNQKKGSKVITPTLGARYLEYKHQVLLQNYIDKYIEDFDYVSRGNLLAFDIYGVYLLPEAVEAAYSKMLRKKKKAKFPVSKTTCMLKRAYPDDEDKIVEYYIKYLTKYDLLGSPEAAREDIQFWMRFGSIYYIERNGQVAVMGCVTVNRHGYISFSLYSYYSTVSAQTMLEGVVTCLSDAIMDEHKIPYLPICVNMITPDSLTYRIIGGYNNIYTSGDVITSKTFFTFNDAYPQFQKLSEDSEEFKEGVLKFKNFITRFRDIEDEIQAYLQEKDMTGRKWLSDEILGKDFFDRGFYRDMNKF